MIKFFAGTLAGAIFVSTYIWALLIEEVIVIENITTEYKFVEIGISMSIPVLVFGTLLYHAFKTVMKPK